MHLKMVHKEMEINSEGMGIGKVQAQITSSLQKYGNKSQIVQVQNHEYRDISS